MFASPGSRANGYWLTKSPFATRTKGANLPRYHLASSRDESRRTLLGCNGHTRGRLLHHRFGDPTPRRRSAVSAARGFQPVAPLLCQHPRAYSSCSASLMFGCCADYSMGRWACQMMPRAVSVAEFVGGSRAPLFPLSVAASEAKQSPGYREIASGAPPWHDRRLVPPSLPVSWGEKGAGVHLTSAFGFPLSARGEGERGGEVSWAAIPSRRWAGVETHPTQVRRTSEVRRTWRGCPAHALTLALSR